MGTRHGSVAKGQGPVSLPDREPLVFRQISRPEDLEKVFRLRYQVFVVEQALGRAEDHPRGIAHDRFDAVAQHFLCETPEGLPIGTLRLILPSPLGFPVEDHCLLFIDPGKIPRDRLGEISHLAVRRAYQRRREDPFHPAPPDRCETSGEPRPADRRRSDIVLGLYREVYHATRRLDITHWYAAMEDKLWILLRRFGFVFEPIGPHVNYHGRRAPFLADVSAVEAVVGLRSPAFPCDVTAGR